MENNKNKKWDVSIETRCQGMDLSLQDQHGAISFPIYQTATFSHASMDDKGVFQYSRLSNPTRQQLETVISSLENGVDSIAYSSGMAAVATVLELFNPGDNIIIDEDLYGGSIRLFHEIGERKGMTFTAADLSVTDIRPLITEATKGVFLESPTNPMMHVTDLRALADVTSENGLLLIVDNTLLSPYFQTPLDLGADIVLNSGTKYLAGHHDTIGGTVTVRDPEIGERLHYLTTTMGNAMAPFDSWLLLRGIRTLAVRMDRAQENALKIAEYLKTQKHVKRVIYPGLEEHPGHELLKKQARGYGSMITFEVDSKEVALSVLQNVEVFYFAESLGGTETLITYPITQTHAEVPPELLAKNGITDRVLRLSVGIEGAQDIINEFERVFELAEQESAE